MKAAATITAIAMIVVFICNSCSNQVQSANKASEVGTILPTDSVVTPQVIEIDIEIEKDLSYDQHTLPDVYPYKDTIRVFQWDKIHSRLVLVEQILRENATWGVLQNYKNRNGAAPLVKEYQKNEYDFITDTFGIERDQSVPLYRPCDTLVAERYGRDGSLVKFISDSSGFFRIAPVDFCGEWLVPKRYIKLISDTVVFEKAIFIDITNQNIATLARADAKWLIRSMNPATTGLHRPPFERKTPVGMFLLQDKTPKMLYYKDGKEPEIGGFAAYANRFSNGGYVHGVPVNEPDTGLVEFSPTLGTTPRSHMCVRNATSHAKFIYNWAPKKGTLVFIFD